MTQKNTHRAPTREQRVAQRKADLRVKAAMQNLREASWERAQAYGDIQYDVMHRIEYALFQLRTQADEVYNALQETYGIDE